MNDVSTDMVQYYAQRAAEYERIYEKPERQHDIATLKRLCAEAFVDHRVIELSCDREQSANGHFSAGLRHQ